MVQIGFEVYQNGASAPHPMKPIIDMIRAGDSAAVKAALARDPSIAKKAQFITEAGRVADLAILKLMKNAGADLNAIFRGYRPLHSLIQERPHGGEQEADRGRLECLEWMLQNGADPELHGAWPPSRAILTAAFMGAAPFVEILKKRGAAVDGFVYSAFGDVAKIKKLIQNNKNFVSERDGGALTALQCACAAKMGSSDTKIQKGLRECVEFLLESGADPNITTKTWSHEVDAAYFAVGSGDIERLKILLDRGADATEALRSALWTPRADMWELARARGGRFDKVLSNSKPLLNDLIRWGQFQPAIWMLQKGADPNIQDADGWTALHQAASRGNVNMIKAVLAAGGDVDAKDKFGKTPKMVAKPGLWLKVR